MDGAAPLLEAKTQISQNEMPSGSLLHSPFSILHPSPPRPASALVSTQLDDSGIG